jgi:hypothetical protein
MLINSQIIKIDGMAKVTLGAKINLIKAQIKKEESSEKEDWIIQEIKSVIDDNIVMWLRLGMKRIIVYPLDKAGDDYQNFDIKKAAPLNIDGKTLFNVCAHFKKHEEIKIEIIQYVDIRILVLIT